MRLSPSSTAGLELAEGSGLLFCTSAFVAEPQQPGSCGVCSATYCQLHTKPLSPVMDGFSSGKKRKKRKKAAGKLSDHGVDSLADPGAHRDAGGLPESPAVPNAVFTAAVQALG